MRRFYVLGFLILLCFDTLAQVGFKMVAVNTAPAAFDVAWLLRIVSEKWMYAALFGYIGAFLSYMRVLKHAPIGSAFAATHLEIVTVSVVSVLFLHETLSPTQIAGSSLIVAGIFVLAGQGRTTATKPIELSVGGPEPVLSRE